MFSSEQILKISGDMDQLEMALKFAFDMYGYPKTISYQVTADGKYCLGWGDYEGWSSYPFDFDVHIVSEIIKQHLNKQQIENPYEDYDGSSERGFLMSAVSQTFSDLDEGIRHPFYGIVSIEAHYNYYAK